MNVLVIEERAEARDRLLDALVDEHAAWPAASWEDVALVVNEGRWWPQAVVLGQAASRGELVRVLRHTYGEHLRVVLYIEEPTVAAVLAKALVSVAHANAWVTDAELPLLHEVVAGRVAPDADTPLGGFPLP